METPTIDEFLDSLDKYTTAHWFMNGKPVPFNTIATELRALIADRDAWKAKAAPVPPVRTLREYTCPASDRKYSVKDGRVMFLDVDATVWRPALGVHPSACAGVADLMANPYEPVETVEDVLKAALNRAYTAGRSDNCMFGWEGIDALTELTAEKARAAVHAETPGAQ